MAVYVTAIPWHTGDAVLGFIVTETGAEGLTVIVNAFDVTGLFVTHALLDVIIQRTWFPVTSEFVVYVLEFVPTLFHADVNTCHW